MREQLGLALTTLGAAFTLSIFFFGNVAAGTVTVIWWLLPGFVVLSMGQILFFSKLAFVIRFLPVHGILMVSLPAFYSGLAMILCRFGL